MGVDLTLFIVKTYGLNNNMWDASSRLKLDRDYELQSQIKSLGNLPIPFPMYGYFGDNYEQGTNDAYGTLLQYVESYDFKDVDLTSTTWNNDVVLFLASMKNTKIVLYWH